MRKPLAFRRLPQLPAAGRGNGGDGEPHSRAAQASFSDAERPAGSGPSQPAPRPALGRQEPARFSPTVALTDAWTALIEQFDDRLRLERVIATALDAIVMVGADGNIRLFNRAAERIFRCPAAEAVGGPVDRFIPAHALAAAAPAHDPAAGIQADQPHPAASPVQYLQALRSDGSSFPAELVVSEADEAVHGYLTIIVRDMSSRRIAEQELRTLSTAVEQTGDGVCITDRNGIIEYVNPAFEQLLGFTRDEMIGKRPSSFRSGKHPPSFYSNLWESIVAGGVFRRIFVDKRADGEPIHLDQTITPLTDDEDRITHFVSISRDVTPRIRTEEALRRVNDHLEAQATAIAQSLHDEAGQLLTSAHIALVEAARDMPRQVRDRLDEVRRHLDGIEEQVRRIAHELRPPILDSIQLMPALTFLAEGVEQRWGLWVLVEGELPESLPRHIESAVYRLVQEGLTNVTRYARAAHVTIRLGMAQCAVRCTIEDDGVGFDAAALHCASGRPGMGLRGARDRIEALGGTLEISSAPGLGTRLIITIPLET
jgi:PAS domain S-box-containing protein